ncbi:MAG: hypothetical protein CFE45_05890 [Burkholderiales bacterium PBB5]|nr:MAG: hypothetical protein CFE45_05890 [Burkholderiales bacterium PBB5]
MIALAHTPLTRAAAALTLAAASLSAHADVASLSFSGSLATSFELTTFNLDVASASDLSLWTTSFAAGNFDPVVAIFDRGNGALLSFSDDVDSPYAQVDASQGALDAGIRITALAAGHYLVAVRASPPLPAGSSWAEGYMYGSTGGAGIDSSAAGWAVRAELTNAAPVPEPTPTALLLAGLAVVGLLARRRA